MDKIKKIESYGQFYIDRFLCQQIADKNKIHDDWYEALKFLFTKVFYRGRRDDLSERFMNATVKTLDNYKLNANYDPYLLEKQLEESGVNNKIDRRMVIECIDFIFNNKNLKLYGNNITRYTIDQIKNQKIHQVFEDLDKIYAIGDKLASFYLRDVIIIYQLKAFLEPKDYKYCQPVDTWVKKVTIELKIIHPQEANIEIIKDAILKKCLGANISPLLFNAGAWIVGSQSFDLLIESLCNETQKLSGDAK